MGGASCLGRRNDRWCPVPDDRWCPVPAFNKEMGSVGHIDDVVSQNFREFL